MKFYYEAVIIRDKDPKLFYPSSSIFSYFELYGAISNFENKYNAVSKSLRCGRKFILRFSSPIPLEEDCLEGDLENLERIGLCKVNLKVSTKYL